MLFNGLGSEKIYPGQKIHLYPKPVFKEEFVTIRPIPLQGMHKVVKGETIYRIAKMYDLNIIDLLENNNLKSMELKSGQNLMLRSPTTANDDVDSSNIVHEKPLYTEPEESVQKVTIIPEENPYDRNDLVMPVEGTVTSEFGIRNGKPHKGIDISAPVGTPVHAVLDGKVVYTGVQRGYGNVIILEHQDYVMTVYAHNDANFVRLGDKVKKGQPIAAVGDTGTTSGPHLHFEYRIQGKAINPREVLPDLAAR